MKNKPSKRNIVTPYAALLADIRSFTAKFTAANNPKMVSRGTLNRNQLTWLHECVKTADLIGYRVEARVKDDDTLEFLMVEKTRMPHPNWRWQ